MTAVLGLVLYTGILAALVFTGRLPPLPALSYLPAAALLFAVYAYDKAAAVRGFRRVPERLLHGLALANGWPGAWLAQAFLRHKTRKSGFLRVFWLTVCLECGGRDRLGAVAIWMKQAT
ncbi:DUF1294 domain-containing protein [Neisseria shayeganii]|uniref:DUF1294 domain-containing protein n=1 Tax=Neisseria shayeganii TaxID=607712 RepID=UPI0002FA4C31|nr:DUF1294 domain-containing protein [Neisseria shayeganii]